MLELPAISR